MQINNNIFENLQQMHGNAQPIRGNDVTPVIQDILGNIANRDTIAASVANTLNSTSFSSSDPASFRNFVINTIRQAAPPSSASSSTTDPSTQPTATAPSTQSIPSAPSSSPTSPLTLESLRSRGGTPIASQIIAFLGPTPDAFHHVITVLSRRGATQPIAASEIRAEARSAAQQIIASSAEVQNRHIQNLLQRTPGTSFSKRIDALTDEQMRFIEQYRRSVTSLSLPCSFSQLEILRLFDFFPNLHALHLPNGPNPSALQQLVTLNRLTRFEIDNTSASNIQSFAPLASATRLAHLALRNAHIDSLNDLPALENLVSLDLLNNHGATLRDFSPISQLQHLTTLNLSATQIQDLTHINTPNLTSLNLSNCIDIDDTSPLSVFNNLRDLNLSGTQIQDLTHINAPNLTSLNLSRCGDIGNTSPFPVFNNLRDLNLQCAGYNVGYFTNMNIVATAAPVLRTLNVAEIPHTNLLPLARCRELTHLTVTDDFLYNADGRHGLPPLTLFERVAQCTLIVLNPSSRIDHPQIAALRRALPNLQVILIKAISN